MTIATTPLATWRESHAFRDFTCLTLPLMLALCTANLVGFCDRAFLANSSMMELGGYVSGFILVRFFQVPLMRLTSLGQAFVGYYEGSQNYHRVGESVWQMIWLSFLSILLIAPLGYGLMPLVFGGTSVQDSAVNYFTWMLWGMFLLPLQTALTAFFVGQKRTKIVFITMLGAQCVHVWLEYLLIFGVGEILPPLGAVGVAIATLADQLLTCFVLFWLFLRREQREVYGTGRYHFQWKIFYEQVRAAVPFAIAPVISGAAWVAISRVMALNDADYLLVFSIGTTLTACFTFIPDALMQAVMTTVSGALGKGNFSAIRRLVMHALGLMGICMLLLAIPYIVFPGGLLYLLSITSQEVSQPLVWTCYFSWLYLLCQGIQWIGMGMIAATRQTLYFVFTGCLQWVTGFVPFWITMWVWRCDAGIFWALVAANALIIGALFYWKSYRLLGCYKQAHSL